MKKTLLVGLVVLGLLQACAAAPGPSNQTPQVKSSSSGLMLELSLQELANLSNWIITGTVTGQESKWNAGHTGIITVVKVDVSQWVKGVPFSNEPKITDSNILVITVPGGKVGNEAHGVEDMPAFSNGEKVLLFLKPGAGGVVEVAGNFQGKYGIVGTDAVPYNPAASLKLDDLVARIKALAPK